jgi:hypothetical protein
VKTNIFILIILTLVALLLFACHAQTIVSAAEADFSPANWPMLLQHGEAISHSTIQATTTELSCVQPLPDEAQACYEREQQILATTVRIKMHGWIESEVGGEPIIISRIMGHATIKDGRYLVTHNHLGQALAAFADGAVTGVSLYKVNGETILPEAPLTTFTVAAADAQTLLLEFEDDGGHGLFDTLSLPSAEFKAWDLLSLQPGMEVAQVNWDGATVSVQWVTIEAIITDDGTPRLQLGNVLRSGSSGGGVFWHGYHIANNWSRTLVRDNESGEIVRKFSTVALNSPSIVTPIMTEVATAPTN